MWGYELTLSSDNPNITDNASLIPGMVLVTPGSVVVPPGSVVVTTGSVVVPPGSVVVPPGSVVTTGSILVTPGSVITTGSILVTPGSVITTGSILVQICSIKNNYDLSDSVLHTGSLRSINTAGHSTLEAVSNKSSILGERLTVLHTGAPQGRNSGLIKLYQTAISCCSDKSLHSRTRRQSIRCRDTVQAPESCESVNLTGSVAGQLLMLKTDSIFSNHELSSGRLLSSIESPKVSSMCQRVLQPPSLGTIDMLICKDHMQAGRCSRGDAPQSLITVTRALMPADELLDIRQGLTSIIPLAPSDLSALEARRWLQVVVRLRNVYWYMILPAHGIDHGPQSDRTESADMTTVGPARNTLI
ncbi:hypothetical protein Tco_0992066 [Tanacetum coccineum]|uniref:Uncharacterized protein n=1 Tax=Tanacetum coccineum TaxID=301880 RepID=A0ABQ5F2R7_9ASTR